MKNLLDMLKDEEAKKAAFPSGSADLLKRLEEVKKQVADVEKKARRKVQLGFAVIAFHALAAAILWPYLLNSWLNFAERPADVVWWQGLALSFVTPFRKGVYLLTAVTWIAMLFLG